MNDSGFKELKFKDDHETYEMLVNKTRREEFLRNHSTELNTLLYIIAHVHDTYTGLIEDGRRLGAGNFTVDKRYPEFEGLGLDSYDVTWGDESKESKTFSTLITGSLLGKIDRGIVLEIQNIVLERIVSKLEQDKEWKIHAHDILSVIMGVKELADVVTYKTPHQNQ